MHQQEYTALGLMSGTSLDGLDLCLVRFWHLAEKWHFKMLKTDTIAYTPSWQARLKNAHNLSKNELLLLNEDYGNLLGHLTHAFIEKQNHPALDFIASHGHTVLHQPEHKITLQIGNGPQIMQKTNLPVVCDFRVQDVLLGGQGAPLVPIGDQLLFSDFTACLNLGGFANISYQNKNRIAFDICPVNIVLNGLAEMLGNPYDASGAWAKNGTVNATVLKQLNELSFYTQAPPKSLGREWVENNVHNLLKGDTPQNLLATFTAHAAAQICGVIQKLPVGKVLVTGGGAFNSHLIQLIKLGVPKHDIVLPDSELISQKEALIFAFLGLLRWKNSPNCLASVTGAPRNHSSGKIYLP